jgi:hypothetical protein
VSSTSEGTAGFRTAPEHKSVAEWIDRSAVVSLYYQAQTMNKHQFWTLNFLNLVLVVLLFTHFVSVSRNSQMAQSLASEQAFINQAQQQTAPVLDRLARRIAIGSEKDPRLKEILVKYGLQVTVDVEGKKKTYP